MYVGVNTIISAASLLTALGVIFGAVIGVYKTIQSNKEQTHKIHQIQMEQELIVYGVLCCLKGLKEQGCNGPVTEALTKLEKHLNKMAHESDDTL